MLLQKNAKDSIPTFNNMTTGSPINIQKIKKVKTNIIEPSALNQLIKAKLEADAAFDNLKKRMPSNNTGK